MEIMALAFVCGVFGVLIGVLIGLLTGRAEIAAMRRDYAWRKTPRVYGYGYGARPTRRELPHDPDPKFDPTNDQMFIMELPNILRDTLVNKDLQRVRLTINGRNLVLELANVIDIGLYGETYEEHTQRRRAERNRRNERTSRS